MIHQVHSQVTAQCDAIISFLRDLVAIPSYDSNIRALPFFFKPL